MTKSWGKSYFDKVIENFLVLNRILKCLLGSSSLKKDFELLVFNVSIELTCLSVHAPHRLCKLVQ